MRCLFYMVDNVVYVLVYDDIFGQTFEDQKTVKVYTVKNEKCVKL